MPKVITVKSARKDYPESGIKKGDAYYKWKFNFGPEYKSKTYPRRSQLTRSDFLGQLYELQDGIEDRFKGMADEADIQNELDMLIDEIQTLSNEQQERLDGMPEHLQSTSSSGEILQERIDSLESWLSDLGGIDTYIDEELSEEVKEERIQEIISEITSTDCGL